MFKQHLAASHYRLHFQTIIESEPTAWVEYEFVKKQIMEGKVKDDTLVLKKGGSDWLHASDLAELNEFLSIRKKYVLLQRKKQAKAWWERLIKVSTVIQQLATSLVASIRQMIFRGDQATQQHAGDAEQPVDRQRDTGRTGKAYPQAETARAHPAPIQTGILYLVRLHYAGEIYSKIGITRNSADDRYKGHAAEMDIVQEWSLPSIEIAREIEQAILKDFGDFRGAAPDEMDGYTEAFGFQLESQLKAAAERMVLKHAPKPRSTKTLIQELRKQPVNKDVVKRLIGDGGQRLVMTYFNANNERTTIHAIVIRLNGSYLRVCEVGDVNEIAKSIKLNKLITVREG
jgi:hypothetical protein